MQARLPANGAGPAELGRGFRLSLLGNLPGPPFLGRKPQLWRTAHIGEVHSGSLKEKEAWQSPAVGAWFAGIALVAGCVVHGMCWRKEEQMAAGWDPCASGEQMCELSRLRWLSCC